MIEAARPPGWFWIIAIFALLWELMGVGSYLYHVTLTDAQIDALPAGQAELMRVTPAWIDGAFAIATWGGLLGAIGLLLRRRWSRALLLVSVIAAAIQFGYIFTLGRGFELVGTEGAVFPVVIVLMGALLVWFADHAAKRAWLR